MKFPPSSFCLHLAAVYFSCFGAVTRGRALSAGQQASTPPLSGVQEGSFIRLLNHSAVEAADGSVYHSKASGPSDAGPEDLEEAPTSLDRAASVGHEDSLLERGVHNHRGTFGTNSLQTSVATSQSASPRRRREREAPRLSDDEGSGFSSETEWDDEDLFLQQRRASRRGRKGGPTPGRRKNVDWLQLQGVASHHADQKTDHSQQQVPAKNELPSRDQSPGNEGPARRPHPTNTAKRRSKKRHRMKTTKQPSSRLLPTARTEPSSSGGSHTPRRHHQQQQQQQQRQQQQQQPLQLHRTAAAQPLPRKFGGGDMSLESRIRALKKIASDTPEDEADAALPLELPAFYSGDRPDGVKVPPPPASPKPPPLLPGRSTAATPVTGAAAAHIPPPTQSRHFAYHRVTEAQSAAAASHHQEAFVAVSMVDLPGNHSWNHSSKNHDQAQQHVSPETLSTRTARYQTPATTTATSLFRVAPLHSDVSSSGRGSVSGDPWDSGGLQPLPTWFRLRHRGRNHFHKGAMEELMNRHREEEWLRRRFGLPPENPHQQFAG